MAVVPRFAKWGNGRDGSTSASGASSNPYRKVYASGGVHAPAHAVTAALVRVVEYIAKAYAVFAAHEPEVDYIAKWSQCQRLWWSTSHIAVIAASAPVVENIAPAPAVTAAPAMTAAPSPVVEFTTPAQAWTAAPALVDKYISPAPARPVDENIAPAPVVSCVAPAPAGCAAPASVAELQPAPAVSAVPAPMRTLAPAQAGLKPETLRRRFSLTAVASSRDVACRVRVCRVRGASSQRLRQWFSKSQWLTHGGGAHRTSSCCGRSTCVMVEYIVPSPAVISDMSLYRLDMRGASPRSAQPLPSGPFVCPVLEEF